MFLCQVSGKLVDFSPAQTIGGAQKLPAYCTLVERRYIDGQTTEARHFLLLQPHQEEFVKKCIEKTWTVVAFTHNPVMMTDMNAVKEGYILTMNLSSVQLP